jgi:hypothetical protein
MTFDRYFDLNDKMSFDQKIVAFGVGLAPAALQMEYLKLDAVSIRAKQGPSLVSACNLCASLAATEALMIILKKGEPKAAPYYLQMDPYLKKLKQGYLWGGNRHPWQRIKRWYAAKKLAHAKAA